MFSFISNSLLSSVLHFVISLILVYVVLSCLMSVVKGLLPLFWNSRYRFYLFGQHDFLRCPYRYFAPYYWPHHGFACFVLLDCFLLPTFEKLIFWTFGRICETKVHFMDYPLLFCFVMLFCHIVLKSRAAFFLRFLGCSFFLLLFGNSLSSSLCHYFAQL